MIRKTILTLSVAAAAITLTACNTVQGLGRDIESVGRTGEDVIDGD